MRFGQFAPAGAGETLRADEASQAADRLTAWQAKRRARAMRLASQVWGAIELERGTAAPDLPLVACWLEGGSPGGEIDYYCDQMLGTPGARSWDQAKVARWIAPLHRDDYNYLKSIPRSELARAISLAWETQEDRDTDKGVLPDALALELVADALGQDSILEGGIRLVNLPRSAACKFIVLHHSALPYCNLRGMMYALGAVVPGRDGKLLLVAVATANTPSSRWNSRGCSQHGTLELTRIASIGGLKTRDRKGRVRPLAASSKLTARLMDLLPQSGRRGEKGCRFVTYSLESEAGTTYLSLASKGQRPVQYNEGQAPSGARKKAGPRSLAQMNKIVWEAGPAARPPKWDLVPARQRQGAQRAFGQYLALQRRRPSR